MNKKFVSAILFGTLAVSTGMFVSCKDYDDDVDRLQMQIDQNATTAANDLASKIAALESQISTLNSAKQDLASQLATAKSEAAAAAANALAAAQTAQAAADAAKAGGDAAAAAAAKASELAQKGVDGAVAAQSAANAAAAAAANAQNTADKATDAVAAAQKVADQAIAEISAAVARVATLETKVANLETITNDLKVANVDLNAKISDLQTQMAAVKTDTKANADAIAAANAEILAKYSELSGKISEVSSALGARIDVIDATLNTIQANYATKDELNSKATELAAMDAQLNSQIAINLKYIETLQATVKDLATKDAELAGKIESNYNALLEKISAVVLEQSNMLKTIEALQAASSELKTQYSALSSAKADLTYVDNINNQLTTLVNSLQKTLNDLTASDASQAQTINTLLQDVSGLKDKTKDLQDLVAKNADASDKALQEAIAQLQSEMREAGVASDEALGQAVNEIKALVEENAKEIATIKEELDKKADKSKLDELAESLILTQSDVMEITLGLKNLKGDIDEGLTELKGDVAIQKSELETQIADAEKAAKDYAYDLILKLTDMVNANTGNIATNTEAIDALQAAIEDLSDMTNGRLSDFVTSTEQKDALDDLYNGISQELDNYVEIVDLKRLYADREEMNDSLNVLKEAIDDFKATYNSKMEEIDGKLSEINAYLTDLGLVNTAISKRLTSISLVPSTYVDGIEAIVFKTLKYDVTKDGKMVTYYLNNETDNKAVYRMNPSGVTLDCIDEANAKFVANKATNRSTRASIESPIKVSGLSLDQDGDLVVNVQKTSVNESFAGTDNFYIAALQLPIKSDYWTVEDENAVVQSEYVRLDEYTFTPQLHAKQYKNDNAKIHLWTLNELDGAANVGKNNYVEVAYDEELDLMTLVNVCEDNKDHTVCDYESYGLKIEFELYKNEQGENETENEKFAYFVNEEKTVIASCVYDGGKEYTKNPAAVGREPIIHVRLIDTKNGNNIVDEQYMKIKWNQETIDPSDVELGELTDGVIYDYNCTGFEWTLNTIQMNQMIYGAENVKMSSKEFHSVYVDMALRTEGVGSVTPIVDDINGVTSYNLKWTVTPADFQNAITNFNGDKVLEAKCIWESNNGRGDIIFTLKMTIKKPVYGIYGYNSAYWTEGAFQMNPIVYNTDKAKATVTINTDLVSNGFNGQTTAPAKDMVDVITVQNFDSKTVESAEIVFDASKFEATIGKGYTVSEDGKTLMKGNEVAARIITKDGAQVLVLEESGAYDTQDYGTASSEATEAAKTLVGKQVPVKVVVDPCGDDKYLETVLNYNAAIKNPFDISSNLTDVFYETTVGGSKVNVSEALEMVDWNGYVVANVKNGSMGADEKYKYTRALYKYYAISDIKWDTDNAKTNIQADENGNLVPSGEFGDIWPDGASFSYDPASNSLVYKNNGATLGKEFVITCPVEVTYKWGVLTANVQITVKPGSGIDE